MSRRTPFPFAEHHDPEVYGGAHNDLIERLIQGYEEALLVEYKSGDLDVASYHEGLREAREEVLVDLLGIEQSVMDAYWQRTPRPAPETYDLPLLSDPDNWLITYEQIAEWSSRRLNAEQWDALNEAIPNSLVPEAITALVAVIAQSEEG
jgi:hypothetical protein